MVRPRSDSRTKVGWSDQGGGGQKGRTGVGPWSDRSDRPIRTQVPGCLRIMDRNNWADYEPQVMIAMKANGIWKHVLGTAYEPKLYTQVNGITVLSDGKTPATEEQIMEREENIDEYDGKENTTRHVILSTTSIHLGVKVKNLGTAKEMWDEVKRDATTKSTLFIINVEDELSTMKCQESSDPKMHLTEITAHYESFWFTKLGLVCSPGLTVSKIFNNFLSLLIPSIDTEQTHCC